MGNGMCKMWPGAAKGQVGPPRPATLPTKTLQGAVNRNNAKQVIQQFTPMGLESPASKFKNHTLSVPPPPSTPPPPQRPPRRRRPRRSIQPVLPPPPRMHSALSLPLAGLPPAPLEGSPSPQRQKEIHKYLRRCHSYGAVPALIEEMVARLPSPSSSSSASPALPLKRLPASSATPPPSPSSTPPHSPRHAPRFFIGARSASSSSNAQDPPSPGGLYLRGLSSSTTAPGAWDPALGTTRKDAEHQLRAGLRRAKSQGTVGGSSGPRGRHRGGPAVAPLTEHVIEMLPTSAGGPPTLTRTHSSPAMGDGGGGGGEGQLIEALGDSGLHVVLGSEGLAAALQRSLRAQQAQRVQRSGSVVSGQGKDEEDGGDWLEDTPSLGELEDALAQMLEEEEWMLELERKASELSGDGDEGSAPAARRDGEVEAMKRVNTFMALSALTRGED